MIKYFLFATLFVLGCRSVRILEKKSSTVSPRTIGDSLSEAQIVKGIDFSASGSIPEDWTLDIDFATLIRFDSKGGTRARSTPTLPNIYDSVERYVTKSTYGDFEILIYSTNCVSPSEKKKVEVKLNNQLFQGCGKFLQDYRLQNIWRLEVDNNQPVSSANYGSELPRLEFFLNEGRLVGSDGCSDFRTTFELKGNQLKFGAISSNSVNCTPASLYLKRRMELQSIMFRIEGTRLILLFSDDSAVIFKRND
jgi:heat shock protein HslJ